MKKFFLFILTLCFCSQNMTAEVITGTCGNNGDNVTFSLDTETGVLAISGSGAMADYLQAPWYSNRSQIQTATIEEGVTRIGNYAFYQCSGLTGVTIPNSVTNIGSYAFYWCSGLTSVTIPNSVTSIGGGAFYYCSGLESVTIPDGVTSIGGQAFSGCSGLTSVTIPSSVASIGSLAFASCTGLTEYIVAEGNAGYSAIEGVLFNKEGDILISYPNAKAATYVIPGGVTSIGDGAFSGCTGLESVSISDGVTSIGGNAFSGCNGLTSITISDGVTSIGGYAFGDCRGLTSITIPESVTSIGWRAFADCTGLKEFTVAEGNAGYSAIEGVLFNKEGDILISYPNAKAATYVIPGGVTSIGDGAFSGCTGLESVSISDGVTSIGDGAFNGCNGLISITIPNSVTSIGIYAFFGCTGLESVTIGSGVTSIGQSAFESCSGLKEIYSQNPTPPDATTAFNTPEGEPGVDKATCIVYVPEGAVAAYQAAEGWSEFANIVEEGTEIRQIAAEWIDSIPAQTYTGDSIKPAVTVTDSSKILTPGTDYTVAYTDNVNAGLATATVTGKGNYTGTASKTFTILPQPADTVPQVVAQQDSVVLQPDSSLAGGFTLSLTIPVDSKPEEGSTITLTFPIAGFTLDTVNTKVSAALSALFELLFTRLGDVEWQLTIVNKPQFRSLRAAADAVTQDIVDVRYIIGKDVPGNDYAITSAVDIALVDNDGATVAEIREAVSVPVEIPRIAVTGIHIDAGSLILEKGDIWELAAAIEPEDADNKGVRWTSNSSAVTVTVSGGRITAVSAGEATITATTDDGGYTAICNIRVLGDVTTIDRVDTVITTIYVSDTVTTTINDTVTVQVLDTVTTIINDTVTVVTTDTVITTINDTVTVYTTDTVTTIIADTVYDIIHKDSIKYNIEEKDSIKYNIITEDSIVYNIIIKDSIDYTLVPDTVYIPVVTDITGAEHVVTANARVVEEGGGILIQGLEPNAEFSIYTVKGEKYATGIADAAGEYRLTSIDEGLYILFFRDKAGKGQYSKFYHRKQ